MNSPCRFKMTRELHKRVPVPCSCSFRCAAASIVLQRLVDRRVWTDPSWRYPPSACLALPDTCPSCRVPSILSFHSHSPLPFAVTSAAKPPPLDVSDVGEPERECSSPSDMALQSEDRARGLRSFARSSHKCKQLDLICYDLHLHAIRSSRWLAAFDPSPLAPCCIQVEK